MSTYPGMEQDIGRLDATGRRLQRVGSCILVLLGPWSAFLFGGMVIAAALGQPIARRAAIVFPILAFVVFGSGVGYRRLARHVQLGRPWGVIASLGIAALVSILGMLDFWPGLVGDWIVIARIVVVLTNLAIVNSLIRSLPAALRIRRWLASTIAPG